MKTNTILRGLTIIPFVVGCGGGSDLPTATDDTSIPMATISGTVPGTLIEAFCEDGSYAQVSSTQNGSAQHPFSLKIPMNTNCSLIMTTNENDPDNRIITPINFMKDTSNGTTVSLNEDLDLSHVALSLNYNEVEDTNRDHVVDVPFDIDIAQSNANVTDMPVSDSNNNGMIDAYEDRDNDGIVNAYEDDNNNDIPNLHEDNDQNNIPDYMDDEDHDGVINHYDDENNNGHPDYEENGEDHNNNTEH